jgi:hypothetical protein
LDRFYRVVFVDAVRVRARGELTLQTRPVYLPVGMACPTKIEKLQSSLSERSAGDGCTASLIF